jgi:hypothetical protein
VGKFEPESASQRAARAVRSAALVDVRLSWRVFALPLLLIGPLLHRFGSPDFSLVLSVAGGALAGAALHGSGNRPRLAKRMRTGLACAALVLAVGASVVWEASDWRMPRLRNLPILCYLASFGVAAAVAGRGTAMGRTRYPLGPAVGALLGALLPLRAYARLSDLLFALPAWIAIASAAALALGRGRRVAAALLCFGALAMATPRYGYDGRFVRGLTGVGAGTGSGNLVFGLLFTGIVLAGWRLAARRRRTLHPRPRLTRVELLQLNPWPFVVLLGGVAYIAFSFPGLGLGPRPERLPPGWRMLVAGIPTLLLAFLVHVTCNAHGMLAKSAPFAAIPVAAAPLALQAMAAPDRTARAMSFIALSYVGVCLVALVSARIAARRGDGHPFGIADWTLVLAAAVGFLYGGLDRHASYLFAWLVLVPVAFHAVVVSSLPSRWIARALYVLAPLAGWLTTNASAPYFRGSQRLASRTVVALLVIVAWCVAGALAVLARRFRASSPVPPGHPIHTDFRRPPLRIG